MTQQGSFGAILSLPRDQVNNRFESLDDPDEFEVQFLRRLVLENHTHLSFEKLHVNEPAQIKSRQATSFQVEIEGYYSEGEFTEETVAQLVRQLTGVHAEVDRVVYHNEPIEEDDTEAEEADDETRTKPSTGGDNLSDTPQIVPHKETIFTTENLPDASMTDYEAEDLYTFRGNMLYVTTDLQSGHEKPVIDLNAEVVTDRPFDTIESLVRGAKKVHVHDVGSGVIHHEHNVIDLTWTPTAAEKQAYTAKQVGNLDTDEVAEDGDEDDSDESANERPSTQTDESEGTPTTDARKIYQPADDPRDPLPESDYVALIAGLQIGIIEPDGMALKHIREVYQIEDLYKAAPVFYGSADTLDDLPETIREKQNAVDMSFSPFAIDKAESLNRSTAESEVDALAKEAKEREEELELA